MKTISVEPVISSYASVYRENETKTGRKYHVKSVQKFNEKTEDQMDIEIIEIEYSDELKGKIYERQSKSPITKKIVIQRKIIFYIPRGTIVDGITL